MDKPDAMTLIPSKTHLVLIPSYNSGQQLLLTVQNALQVWSPVWVVTDGSTDGSDQILLAWATEHPEMQDHLRIIQQTENQGKGAAVLAGAEAALAAGFTHALTMDADGQHPYPLIPAFMAKSAENVGHMILGKPVFDADAPRLRVNGRKVSNGWANLETLWMGIGDSLYGFRVYPLAPLVRVMHGQRWMRRFDFDPEAVVRLCWNGIRPLNLDAPVRYLTAEEGGISHFKYLRDNTLLTWMHIRLMLGFAIRLPRLLWQKATG